MVNTDNKKPSKVLVSLEEDDEFEDFPIEDWDDNDTKLDGPETLWEEKWDDDDADDEFSIQLREELRKVAN
ncbi:similar to Saccharomyces cerevisiae YDR363W-A SEM1 Component of lid subcomplex of the 26S proteasome regulatory subunit [Geotrichum candidum]|uniref:26S proteasome complex subunit SEM1 n=1 Tax=Geotrichum candidum TaxID=1173061 RepID=A0A0J9XDM7_GEOCN|nr:similar to Saccharomyces cerevisiae YDR363W-A SEM1 Component of lid subcomplex of the 26S proteasome regulatory subunit [Geotrichum candidum]